MEKRFSNDWINKNVKIKDNKVVAKLYGLDGKFIKSVVIPTIYYPLKDGVLKTFSSDSCRAVEDGEMLKIFDSVTFQIGRCYLNAENLTQALLTAGYEAKQYVGWLFLGMQYPVHHSWVVVGNSVLDLSEDYTNCILLNPKAVRGCSWRDIVVDFHIENKDTPKSVRCGVVGIPTNGLLYVGTECGRSDGIGMYSFLCDNFPEHPCIRGGSGKGTVLQQQIFEKLKGNGKG